MAGGPGASENRGFSRAPRRFANSQNRPLKHDVPIVGRGAGTGTSGGALARRGGIMIAFGRMNASWN